MVQTYREQAKVTLGNVGHVMAHTQNDKARALFGNLGSANRGSTLVFMRVDVFYPVVPPND